MKVDYAVLLHPEYFRKALHIDSLLDAINLQIFQFYLALHLNLPTVRVRREEELVMNYQSLQQVLLYLRPPFRVISIRQIHYIFIY